MQPNKGGEEKSYKIMILLEVGNVEKRGRSLRRESQQDRSMVSLQIKQSMSSKCSLIAMKSNQH